MPHYSTTPDEVAIRGAALYLSDLAPAFAGRFEAACRLLVRGGWAQEGGLLRFPCGVAVTDGQCDCQEGRGPVVCLHEVACRILAVAATSRTPPAPTCDDCGSALTPATTAWIGLNTLTICRPCHYARIAAGRRRQIAADAQLIAWAVGV